MKTKLQLMKIDRGMQTLAFIVLMLSVCFQAVYPKYSAFAIMLFVFAGVQVLNTLFLGFKYDDKRRKQYLKVLFWMHGVGSLLVYVFIQFDVNFLKGIAYWIMVIDWLIAPLFLAFWCYVNCWKAVSEAEEEVNLYFSNGEV